MVTEHVIYSNLYATYSSQGPSGKYRVYVNRIKGGGLIYERTNDKDLDRSEGSIRGSKDPGSGAERFTLFPFWAQWCHWSQKKGLREVSTGPGAVTTMRAEAALQGGKRG